MWRRWLVLVLGIWVGSASRSARAQALEAVEVGSKAMEWLGITADQAALLDHLLQSTREMAEHTNEILQLARLTRQATETLRHPSFEDMQEESRARLAEAFPELRHIDAELGTMADHGTALWTNADAQADAGSRREQIRRLASLAGQAALWPRFFGQARRGVDYEPTPTDLAVQRRYQDRHMAKQRAWRGAVVQSLLAQTQDLYHDSLLKDDMLVQTSAISAQANVQAMNDTSELLDERRQEIAMQEQQKAEAEAHRRALLRLVAQQIGSLSQGGGGK